MFRMNSIILGLVSLFVFGTAQAVTLNISSFTDNGDGTGIAEINMTSDVDVSGFQFTLESNYVAEEFTDLDEDGMWDEGEEFVDANGDNMYNAGFAVGAQPSGGAAASNGFMMSGGNGIVLGFSLTGGTIPAMDGVLCNVDVSGIEAADGFIGLTGVTMADPQGQPIESSAGAPWTFGDWTEPVPGCTDMAACNYNADATEDDGSCTYAEENYDCDGNCTADLDCLDECGGSAELDECGECNGDGSTECWDGSFECDAADCPDVPTFTADVTYNFSDPVAGRLNATVENCTTINIQ